MLIIETTDKKGEKVLFSYNLSKNYDIESVTITATMTRERFLEFVKFFKKAAHN